MAKRWLLIGAGLAVVVLAVSAFLFVDTRAGKRPIMVGLLHSTTGPLAALEKPLIEAEKMAIEEINAQGGVLGRMLKPVIADGASQPATFAREAQRLIAVDQVSVIFGCYSSPCRKSVKPIIDENKILLFYPAAYEGVERSSNIVYTAGPANQQVLPAVGWCFDSLKARKFFLVGTDSIWPRVVGALVNDQVKALGGQVVGDEYLLPESVDVAGVVAKIKQIEPDVVVSSLEGITNAPFYEALGRAGVTAARTPVMSFSINEEDLRNGPVQPYVGHYAAWNYFQSVPRQENRDFVQRFRRYTSADRVTNDGITTAYNSVRLWAQAVVEAGDDDAAVVRKAVDHQSLDAPEGIVSIDDNLNNWRPSFVGRILPDGQFEIVSTLSKPVQPLPYPWTRTRAEWNALVANLAAGWGGQWANPARAAPPR